MTLELRGHDERYAIEQLQLALFPQEEDIESVSSLSRSEQYLSACARITLRGKTARAQRRIRVQNATPGEIRYLLQSAYYRAAVQLRPRPDWGSLSGVRPTKLSTRALLAGQTAAQAKRLLETRYDVHPERAELCVECSDATVRAATRLRENDISVYIGIPFCPTRCSYCSFVSTGMEKTAAMLPPYLDALEREIAHTGRLLRESGKTLRTLYIGGGTPSTLSAAQMRRLQAAISTHFDCSELIEYTVECGRPDTLDPEKLRTVFEGGATRTSINPQSMNDSVLAAIGRRHSSAQTVTAYQEARRAGFGAINMDLIAGLPGDTPETFLRSLQQVLALAPENITVHTIALKKGAELFYSGTELADDDAMRQMLDGANCALRAAGYAPYYLYRQKYMAGSYENVGWCIPGTECLYNIYMMEELHSVIALGGGGMTKINLPDGTLERFHAPKYPQQYIDRIEDILSQKNDAFVLLNRK